MRALARACPCAGIRPAMVGTPARWCATSAPGRPGSACHPPKRSTIPIAGGRPNRNGWQPQLGANRYLLDVLAKSEIRQDKEDDDDCADEPDDAVHRITFAVGRRIASRVYSDSLDTKLRLYRPRNACSVRQRALAPMLGHHPREALASRRPAALLRPSRLHRCHRRLRWATPARSRGARSGHLKTISKRGLHPDAIGPGAAACCTARS
jgi:hypothetical protein